MDEKDIRAMCNAAMLEYDEAVKESLGILGSMMEEVVSSDLCAQSEFSAFGGAGALLRPDRAESAFTRDEMLSGVRERRGDFAVVPRIIGEQI